MEVFTHINNVLLTIFAHQIKYVDPKRGFTKHDDCNHRGINQSLEVPK